MKEIFQENFEDFNQISNASNKARKGDLKQSKSVDFEKLPPLKVSLIIRKLNLK